MRAYVFTDAALGRYAGRFVWLSIDTENATNSSFLRKFPINVWPTLMIVDPRKESVILRYSGGATVPQLTKLLTDGEKTFQSKSQNESDKLLAAADKLASQEKTAEALKAYEEAVAKAPKGWGRLGRAAESYTLALAIAGENARCVTAARDLYPKLAGTTSGANVASVGLGCVTGLPADAPDRAELLKYFETATRTALDDPKMAMSGDDRSGLYDSLVSAREDAKDEAGAKKLREEWAAFLEREAANAKTPEQRAVYDSHRVGVYIDLGTPEKAIPMLEQSEKDFPNDYNPPARLALAYKAMKRYDDALAASDRALARAYGPRKIGIYRTRVDIYAGKGDNAAARATLEEAIRYAKALPEGQRSERSIAALEKRLTAMPQ